MFYFKHSSIRVKNQASDSFTPPLSHTSFSTSLKLANNNSNHVLNFGYLHLFTFLSQNASSFYHWLTLSSQKTPFAPMELLEDSEYAQDVSHHLRQEKKSQVPLSSFNRFQYFFYFPGITLVHITMIALH